MSQSKTRLLGFAMVVAAACPLAAAAQVFPSRTIEMIVPFAAGGGVDIIARSVASAMGDSLGQ